jgi:Do/DeqQ family serine protease
MGGTILAGAAAVGTHAVRTPAPVVFAAAPAASLPAQGGYADVVARVSPAVVTVRSTRAVRVQQPMPFDPFEEFFGRRTPRGQSPQAPERREGGLGSGVVVSADGYVLTNHHVIDGANVVDVELTDGRSFKAKVVGSDPPSDLAVLKVDASGLKTLPLGDSDAARVGDFALAVGNPLGVGQTVTMGIISAKGRATGVGDGSFEDFIQTDAPINRGNSGGALVNTRGELIGINSQILSPSGGNIGIGFAIPTNMARDVMEQLVSKGTVRRGMMGVSVQPVTSDIARSLGLAQVQGALVSSVTAGSPAERAGLKRGDVITGLNGHAITDGNVLRNQVARLQPGTSVTVSYLREGAPRQATVSLAELPRTADGGRDSEAPNAEGGAFGLSVAPLTPERAESLGVPRGTTGVVVTGVDPSGPAADAGLREGDVLAEVNGKAVRSASDIRSAVSASKGRPALVLVQREGNTVYVAVTPRA